MVRRLDTELSKDAENVGFRCGFDQSCQHEVEEGVVADHLAEIESLP